MSYEYIAMYEYGGLNRYASQYVLIVGKLNVMQLDYSGADHDGL